MSDEFVRSQNRDPRHNVFYDSIDIGDIAKELRKTDEGESGETRTLHQRRIWVLISFCILSFTNSWIFISLVPFSESLSSHLDVSVDAINSLTIQYCRFYVIFCVPSLWILYAFGLRVAVLVAAFSNFLGTLLRYSSYDSSYVGIKIGCIFCSIAQTFVLSVPPLLSSIWFGENERARATSLSVASSLLGVGFGLAFSESFIKSVQTYFGIQCWAAAISAIIIWEIIADPTPPSPPSLAASYMALIEKAMHDDDTKNDEHNRNDDDVRNEDDALLPAGLETLPAGGTNFSGHGPGLNFETILGGVDERLEMDDDDVTRKQQQGRMKRPSIDLDDHLDSEPKMGNNRVNNISPTRISRDTIRGSGDSSILGSDYFHQPKAKFSLIGEQIQSLYDSKWLNSFNSSFNYSIATNYDYSSDSLRISSQSTLHLPKLTFKDSITNFFQQSSVMYFAVSYGLLFGVASFLTSNDFSFDDKNLPPHRFISGAFSCFIFGLALDKNWESHEKLNRGLVTANVIASLFYALQPDDHKFAVLFFSIVYPPLISVGYEYLTSIAFPANEAVVTALLNFTVIIISRLFVLMCERIMLSNVGQSAIKQWLPLGVSFIAFLVFNFQVKDECNRPTLSSMGHVPETH